MDEKVIDKLHKLLRLQQSPNEHEAALAAALAAELMAKHHLDEAAVRLAAGKDAADQVVTAVIDESKKKDGWIGALANGCARGFGCRLYWHTQRDFDVRRQRRMVTNIELRMVGRKGDIEAASYTLAWLMNELHAIAHREARGQGVAWKNSFKVGAAITIASRLIERRKAVMADLARGANQHAMVLVEKDDAAVEALMQSLHLRPGPPLRISRGDGYQAGQSAGQAVNLDGGKGLGSPAKRLAGK